MRKIFIYKNKTKSKIKTITKKQKRNLKKGTTMKMVGGKLCKS